MKDIANNERTGDWLQTFSGVQFWPLDPQPEEIFLDDVAHALSLICRFTGHTTKFYSVAEHSIRVSHVVPAEDALWGLLHDASEAYLTDLPRPLKHLAPFSVYRDIEERVMGAIAQRFQLPREMPPSVKHADLVLLATEARDLMAPHPAPWSPMPPPLAAQILPMTPEQAELEFLRRFHQLHNRPAL